MAILHFRCKERRRTMRVMLSVPLGDVLLLENKLTEQQAEGKVVGIKRSRDGKVYVGIEFTDFNLNFWHMAFPAPGAKPLRRRYAEKVAALS
jgi:hypothetical protein